MEFIIKGRGKGKTADLIRFSSSTGAVIATAGSVDYIKRLAHDLKLEIPEPINLRQQNFMGRDFSKGVLVDDAQHVLRVLLDNIGVTNVHLVTLTIDD